MQECFIVHNVFVQRDLLAGDRAAGVCQQADAQQAGAPPVPHRGQHHLPTFQPEHETAGQQARLGGGRTSQSQLEGDTATFHQARVYTRCLVINQMFALGKHSTII